ncbi:MAG: FAD-dependent oxidoreductase [Candidatus Borkfalkiaceae bacterium]|nr:FAD-dependent oxidoreductase [Christensenellaceae bacterium]
MIKHDIVIIGGGPAGLAAAISAFDNGVKDVVIIERENRAGGILKQCIHNGFGLSRFKESLTGPEYANRFICEAEKRKIKIYTDTTVISLTKDKIITAINSENGIFEIKANAVILAMGCRERSRGALNIAGTRPAGIFSAGCAQKLVNIKGLLPGKKVVILGSGDIGLIMARRLTLEGAEVLAVCEIMPYSSGLKRNILQCLDDYKIPLYLNHTITRIDGTERVTGVEISRVDENKKPIKGTEMYFDCDTVLFSVGLIPENELSKEAGIGLSPKTRGAIVSQNRETCIDGVFACGNVLHVHDLVDFVSEESETAGFYAANYVLYGAKEKRLIEVVPGKGISYVLPQKLDKNLSGNVKLYFRVNNSYRECVLKIMVDGETVLSRKKKVMLPGEMETFILSEQLISDTDGAVKVEIENDSGVIK